ncbi:ROK family transcriptional regulator [Paenibacillus thermotolerans]|uniref:ROK family transcriptional regulator n=1 Tax=Paenibacillus thermotolerans TaxID=3027807 RepID=UPI002367D623|nr:MULTISPECIES: ROK family transcriptional regulator [unclassified Paenibacillus]
MRKTGSQQVLKEINKSLLLHLIYRHGPISRIELSRMTKLSPTTVSVLIDEHIRNGIVQEAGTTGAGVGRKMTLLRIKPDAGYVLGVDLSNSPARCLLLNLQGELAGERLFDRLIGGEQIERELPEIIRSFLHAQGVEPGLVRRAGISVPGRLDEAQGLVAASTYLKLSGFPLRRVLKEGTGLSFHMMNDLDAAGFAERFSGVAKDVDTIAYVLIGYGVGAGLVINRHIYHGKSGEAGRTGELYPYGTEVLARRLLAEYPEQFTQEPSEEAVVCRFVRLGMEGNEPFAGELRSIKDGIGKYCGMILQFMNPEQLILGGWTTKNDAFFKQLIESIHRYEAAAPDSPTPVKAAYWQERGAAMGAAALGLYEIFKLKTVE